MKLALYCLGVLVLMYVAYKLGFNAGRIKEIENIQGYGEVTIKDFTIVSEPPSTNKQQTKGSE